MKTVTLTFNTGIYYSKRNFYTLICINDIIIRSNSVSGYTSNPLWRRIPWAFAPHNAHSGFFGIDEYYHDTVLSRVQIAPDGELFMQVQRDDDYDIDARPFNRESLIEDLEIISSNDESINHYLRRTSYADRFITTARKEANGRPFRLMIKDLKKRLEANEMIGEPTTNPFRQVLFTDRRDDLMEKVRNWYYTDHLEERSVREYIEFAFNQMTEALEP